MWMSAYRHQSLVTLSVRTRREGTSVPAPEDTSFRRMERAAEVTCTSTKRSPQLSPMVVTSLEFSDFHAWFSFQVGAATFCVLLAVLRCSILNAHCKCSVPFAFDTVHLSVSVFIRRVYTPKQIVLIVFFIYHSFSFPLYSTPLCFRCLVHL